MGFRERRTVWSKIIVRFLLLYLMLAAFTSFRQQSNPHQFQFLFGGNKNQLKLSVDQRKTDGSLMIVAVDETQGSPLFTLCLHSVFTEGFNPAIDRITVAEDSVATAEWTPLVGARQTYQSRYRSIVLAIVHHNQSSGGNQSYQVRLRIFDGWIAMQAVYNFNDKPAWQPKSLAVEMEIDGSLDGNVYLDRGNEGGYTAIRVDDIVPVKDFRWSIKQQILPLTMDLHSGNQIANRYLLQVTEACTDQWADVKVSSKSLSARHLVLVQRFDLSAQSSPGGFESSWFVWHIAKSPKELAERFESTGLLCEPRQPALTPESDLSWIKPGKVLRDMTLSTAGTKALMDYAHRINVSYILLDAGWYGNEYSPASNPLQWLPQPKKHPLDIQEITKYGKSLRPSVGVILYINDIALKAKGARPIAVELKKWGVAGVKMGFVDVSTAVNMQRIYGYVDVFAEFQLVVNMHDNIREYFSGRQHPNLLSTEGVRGDEHADCNIDHILTLPFTRSMAGFVDFTITFEAGRLKDRGRTAVFQAALPFVLNNGLHHLYWYRSPFEFEEIFLKHPIHEIWRLLNTKYENSLVLDAEIGKHIAVGRRLAGAGWIIAGITGATAKTFDIRLNDFVADPVIDVKTAPSDSEHKVKAILYSEGPDPFEIVKQEIFMPLAETISVSVKPASGIIITVMD